MLTGAAATTRFVLAGAGNPSGKRPRPTGKRNAAGRRIPAAVGGFRGVAEPRSGDFAGATYGTGRGPLPSP